MLKNLIKHEMRATGKTFMWLYIAFAIIAVVNVVFTQFWPSVTASSAEATSVTIHTAEMGGALPIPGAMQVLLSTLYILSIVAIAVGTFVVTVLRFYRNLLGDEGYLMMTLPVSREQLIFSKLLVALIWSICSGVLIFLSILLMVAGSGGFADLIEGINMITAMGVPLGQWITLIIITMIVSAISGILMLYAAMAIGPNLLKNRLGGSILAFIIIAVASQIASFITISLSSGIGGGISGIVEVREVMPVSGAESVMPMPMPSAMPVIDQLISSATLTAIISSAIIAIVCWFLTRYMLNKKLNLA